MTKNEKIDVVIDYCNSDSPKKYDCEGCVLDDSKHNWKRPLGDCLIIADSDEEDLDKAIKLIQESEELDKAHNVNELKEELKDIANTSSIPNVVRDQLGLTPIKKNDNVNSPSHYTDGKIEVIDYIEDKKLGFCLGNAIKYISRAGKKYKDKEAEDIKKAIWYLKRYIKNLEEVN